MSSEATPPSAAAEPVTVHRFEADVSEVLGLVINSLYSNKDIFLRELLSNASDALDKQRFVAATQADADTSEELRIRILPDPAAGTLAIEDNGIGMTAEELASNLGTVARSGSKEFLARLRQADDKTLRKEGTPERRDEAPDGLGLIGQFGVGFYSAYLVAHRVEVISRPGGPDSVAHRWESEGKDTFTVSPAERPGRGTTVILHLEDEHKKDLTATWRIRELVRTYSDYLGYPIELPVKDQDSKDKDSKDREGESDASKADGAPRFEAINQARALWQRPAREITDEQYEEFYKHLTHDWEGPLAHKHFQIEGTLLFTGLLFVPRRPALGLFAGEQKHGVRLHVKRVFIMDDCEELLPRWLRFLRGVIDSDDLPLNVSREILQDSHVVRTIRKQVIKQALDMLDKLARDTPDSYATFWQQHGATLSEGMHYDPEHKDRLAGLLRYDSSRQAGLVSLDDYVGRMAEGQPAIYHAFGTSRAVVDASPHIEAIKKKGYEVLYLTRPIDQWAMSALAEYKDKKLVDATSADLDLGDDAAASASGDDKASPGKDRDKAEASDPAHAGLDPLLLFMRAVLQDKVEKVRVSSRLTDSPVCLVVPPGGLQPHIERLLRVQNSDLPATKRVLEVNPDHPLIARLAAVHERASDSPDLREWIEILYEQALMAEGSPVEDPVRMAMRLTRLLETAATQAD